jgi:hypothetical protein
MADIARVKGNIQKMIAQNAPESDIDAYVASEGVTLDELRAPAPAKQEDPFKTEAKARVAELKGQGIEYGLPRRVIQGATLGSADEILAGLSTPLEMIRRGTFNPVEGYQSAKAIEDARLEEARNRQGALGTALEIGGGAGTGLGLARAGWTTARNLGANAGLLRRSAASAADAGLLGGVTGFMEGDGLGDRAQNAAMGAGAGAAIGGAAPGLFAAAGSALAPIVSNIRARVNPAGYARSQVARGVVESGRTPQQISDEITNAAREGQDVFTAADALGNAGQRMLSTVARAPGAGRTMTVDFLEGRQAGQGRRISNALSEGFNAPQTAAQTRTSMTGARDGAADVAYGAARQNARPVDVSRAIAQIDETLQPGVNQIATPQSGLANDSIENALSSFRARLTDGRSQISDFTALQRVRGDLSDTIQAAERAGQGNRARLLRGVLREVDAAMESASPGFRQANREFSQATRNIEAIDEGAAAATRGRTEDIIPRFTGLPAQGQQAYRTGYVDPLIQQTQGAAFGVNKARPLMNDAFAAEAQTMAPGNPLMQRRLGRENTMFETRNHALGNSRTADNLADQSAMGVDPTMIGQVLSGNWGGAIRSALAAGSNVLSGNTPAVREEVARLLLMRGRGMNPQQFQALVDEAVQRMETVRLIAQQAGRGLTAGLGVAPSAAGIRR